jgi:hypothetical protein
VREGPFGHFESGSGAPVVRMGSELGVTVDIVTPDVVAKLKRGEVSDAYEQLDRRLVSDAFCNNRDLVLFRVCPKIRCSYSTPIAWKSFTEVQRIWSYCL